MNGTLERTERGLWHCHTTLDKFDPEAGDLPSQIEDLEQRRRMYPVDTLEVEGNLLTTAGINLMLSLLTGQGGTVFSNANAHLAVGNSATAAADTDTDLIGASKTRKAMRTGAFPSVPASKSVQFSSDFLTGEANYAWAEWAVANASSAGIILNRKVEALGTKTSGTWTLTVTVSIS